MAEELVNDDDLVSTYQIGRPGDERLFDGWQTN